MPDRPPRADRCPPGAGAWWRRPTWRALVAVGGLFAACGPSAAGPAWQPSPGHAQLPIWPSTRPVVSLAPAAESTGTGRSPVAGRPWLYAYNVSRPTLTVYPPRGKRTGAAVIVFPGGGYRILAMDLEGTEVCDWLTSRGITCVLLKYRVPNAGPNWEQFCGCDTTTRSSMPLEDAQRTLGLVRHHAAEWRVDPRKVGVLGFSAGGHLVAQISTRYDRRLYAPVDAADSESCRPDFAIALYPGHMFDYERNALNSDIHFTRDTPPTFIVHAENDKVDGVSNALVYFDEMKNAGALVEMHLYAEGGHAFGLRPTKLPITAWPHLAETWLETLGVIPP